MSRHRSLRFASLMLACSLGLSAQLDRGTITGVVTDPSGAVVPSVKVSIRNTATGASWETVSNAAGQYTRPNLPVGTYEISFSASGFRQLVRRGVAVGVTEVLRVDATLELGATAETIEVTAPVPRLQTDTPEVATSLNNRSLIDLPLSFAGGRTPENFAYKVSPGVTGDSYTNHINGSGAHTKELLLDGASVTVNQSGEFGQTGVSVEAVQEFKVQMSGLSAEFGRAQTAVFNFVMKSGTNDPHGSAYFGLRNEALNANTFSNTFRGARRSMDRRHNWAGSFGAPVYLPKLYDGRNRTFFYFTYEGYKERNWVYSTPNVNAPLADFYQGDFSRLLGPATAFRDALDRTVTRGAIYDPATFRRVGNRWVGDMFPANRIPAARFSQVARNLNAIASKYYSPTIRDANGQVPLTNNMMFPASTNPEMDKKQFSIKVDQNLSSAHKLSGSYNFTRRPRMILDQGGLWNMTEPEGGPLARTRYQPYTGTYVRAGWDWTATPRLLNHLTLSFNRRGNPNVSAFREIDGARELGIKNLSTRGYPTVNWGGGPFVSLQPVGYMQDEFRADQSFGLLNTVSFVKGRHFLKMGFDHRRNHQNWRGKPTASFTFQARGTAIPAEAFSGNQTGYSFASYLLGIVDSAGLGDPVGLGARRNYWALFLQDDFKVNARLTLNLGLRWEYQPPFYEVADRLSNWNPNKIDPVSKLPGAYDFAGTCDVCTGKRSFGSRTLKNFGPRLGLAFRVTPKWVLRGAYGIMYEGDNPNAWNPSILGKPLNVAWGGTYRLSSDAVNPWAGIFNWDDGFPSGRYDPPSFDVSWGNRSRPGMIDPAYGQTPYVQTWNLNIQREITSKLIVDIGYIGTKGTRLKASELNRLNQLPYEAMARFGASLNNPVTSEQDAIRNGIRYPFAGFRGTVASALRPYPQVQGNQTVNVWGSPLGFSTYHALQITFDQQLSHGFNLYGNYVWSKNLANVESSLIDGNSGPLDYYNLRLEKAVTSWDRPQMFKLYSSYQLPMGRGKRLGSGWNRWLDAAAGGWALSAILNYYSGTPLGFGGSFPLSGGWNGALNRANIAPGEMKNAAFDKSKFEFSNIPSAVNTYLNKALFSDPPPLTLGTSAPRYAQTRGFGTISEDFGLQKAHFIKEKYRFQIRAEMLNLFNRHNLGGIQTSVTNPNFGQVTSVSGNRQIQLSARIDF